MTRTAQPHLSPDSDDMSSSSDLKQSDDPFFESLDKTINDLENLTEAAVDGMETGNPGKRGFGDL